MAAAADDEIGVVQAGGSDPNQDLTGLEARLGQLSKAQDLWAANLVDTNGSHRRINLIVAAQ
jgi:hypothetical protein